MENISEENSNPRTFYSLKWKPIRDIGVIEHWLRDTYVSPKFSERHILYNPMMRTGFTTLCTAKYCLRTLLMHKNRLQKIPTVGFGSHTPSGSPK